MPGRVAVFVDGENISAEHAAAILRIVAASGAADIIRVYGNATALKKWDGQPGYRFIHSGTGKNATDILLTVQAMEAALSGSFATVVIASSDRDFTHLVTRVRELGITAIGVGEAKAAGKFRAACSVFELLPPLPAAVSDAARVTEVKVEVCPDIDKLDFKIRGLIQANSKNGKGVSLQWLGLMLHRQHKIRATDINAKNWRTYLESRTELFEIDEEQNPAHVRFIASGFATKH